MREVMWVLIGALFVYVLYQLNRARVLRAGISYYDGYDTDEAPAFESALDNSAWRQEADALRQEAGTLRQELDQQRQALAALSHTIDALREQIESVSAAQGISPEYNEALVCARRGLDVEAIAERCGISVAEAELVRSMSERQGGDDANRP
ncbi:MAG: DUF2802 domain-containing protein [Zoogloeaceae bacterium]|nr:DUF2802 domain-containing protein [Zoogloeaceae bacterium]